MSESPAVIAVLDDEPKMRKALHRLLVTHGFRVDDYERGVEFLAALPTHPADCLVLDLHMPEVSGFDVLSAFAAQQIIMPVVVITGHDEPGTAGAHPHARCVSVSSQAGGRGGPRRSHSHRLCARRLKESNVQLHNHFVAFINP